MHHKLRDIPAVLRAPIGRLQARYAIPYRAGLRLFGVARLYRRILARSTRIVAVVGSFGKTTTARAVMTALGLEAPEEIYRNSGGWIPLAIFGIRPGQRYAVIEAGIGHRGQMAQYAQALHPDITVVTSIGSEHHRSLGTIDVTRNEKAEMVRILSPSSCAVLNGDDPNVRWMAGQTQAQVVTFGFNEDNDVRASRVELDWPNGSRFRLHTRVGTRAVRVRMIGRPMIYPVLAAAAVALAEGLALERSLCALGSLAPTPGRLQPVLLSNGAMLLRDDFKSPEETIDEALHVLARIPAKRRIVVLGDISEPTGSVRVPYRRIGERVGRVANHAIFLAGDNGTSYSAGAKRGGLPPDAVINVHGGVRKAVEALQPDLGPGDVVLIKGRDTQRLERIALALMGRKVRCDLQRCAVLRATVDCGGCPMLERGWEGLRVIV